MYAAENAVLNVVVGGEGTHWKFDRSGTPK